MREAAPTYDILGTKNFYAISHSSVRYAVFLALYSVLNVQCSVLTKLVSVTETTYSVLQVAVLGSYLDYQYCAISSLRSVFTATPDRVYKESLRTTFV